MDAAIALITPQATPSAADNASDAPREDAAAFAAHLEPQTQARPPARKPAPPPAEEPLDTPANDAGAAQSYSLSAPAAPVVVRIDGAQAAIDFSLTPQQAAALSPAALAPAAPAATAPATAPAPAGPVAAEGAQTPIAPAAPLPTGALEAAAQTVAAPIAGAKAEAPGEPLRASGRGRAARDGAESGGETKTTTATAAAPAASPQTARADAGAAATPNVAQAAPPRTEQAPPAPALTDIATASGDLRRTLEAPASAVHRPPTVAQTVAQQVIRRFEGQSTSIEVRLDPAELGRVNVKLDVGADARVTAVVAAENPATLSDLMRSARELERALESAGLELASGGLSFDLSGSRNDFADREGSGDGAATRAASGDAGAIADAATPASRPFGLEAWRGVRVDVTV